MLHNNQNKKVTKKAHGFNHGRMSHMELEKKIHNTNLLFCLARKTPLFVIDERAYYCGGDDRENFFREKKAILGVKEGPCLKALENLSYARLNGECEKYKEDFLKSETKRFKKGEEDFKEHDNLAEFVVKEIFPYLRKDSDELLDKVLETKEQVAKKPDKNKEPDKKIEKERRREIEEYIQKRTAELDIEPIRQKKAQRNSRLDSLLFNRRLSESKSSDSLFVKLLGESNFAIADKKVYELSKASAGGDLEIQNRRYNLVYFCDLEELAKKYSQAVMNSLSKKALIDRLEDDCESFAFKTEKTDAKTICSKREHHEKDFGFIKGGNFITVYVDVPNYVLKSPHNHNLYLFSKHRLGIKIRFNDYSKKPILMESPHSLSDIDGPFYGGDRSLCMGSYTHGYFSRMLPGKAFAKLLVDARNVVLHGYTSRCHPRAYLDDDYFYSRRISPSELKRRKLPITNASYSKGTKTADSYDY
jgi:hypothetical protein